MKSDKYEIMRKMAEDLGVKDDAELDKEWAYDRPNLKTLEEAEEHYQKKVDNFQSNLKNMDEHEKKFLEDASNAMPGSMLFGWDMNSDLTAEPDKPWKRRVAGAPIMPSGEERAMCIIIITQGKVNFSLYWDDDLDFQDVYAGYFTDEVSGPNVIEDLKAKSKEWRGLVKKVYDSCDRFESANKNIKNAAA